MIWLVPVLMIPAWPGAMAAAAAWVTAPAWIRSLVQELPYALSVAEKQKRKIDREKMKPTWSGF